MKIAYLGDARGRSAPFRRPAFTTAVIASLLLMLPFFLPAAAQAIDLALCNDDGVTEVPPFADGRDGNNCLMIDPGNGDPAVPFQYEFFHGPGDPDTASAGLWWSTKDPEGLGYGFRADEYGKCRTKDNGDYCTYLMWDVKVDGYLSPLMKNEDIWRPTDGAKEYLYVKDSHIANGWKCKGGTWSGPNGIGCTSEENSSAHTDGIQMRGQPVNGGWVIFQDSIVANANLILFLIQVQAQYGSNGSFLFQGLKLGQTNEPLGEAEHWIDDCLARGVEPDICTGNRLQMGYHADELWVIDVSGTAMFSLVNNINKLVQVNTGCGVTGCNGEIGYNNGYPHPLKKNSPAGPGDCPNGLTVPVNTGTNGATFCYTSIENALNDQVTATSNPGDCPAPYCPHKAPPFIQLSPTGWENPPSVSGKRRPPSPYLMP